MLFYVWIEFLIFVGLSGVFGKIYLVYSDLFVCHFLLGVSFGTWVLIFLLHFFQNFESKPFQQDFSVSVCGKSSLITEKTGR